MILINLSPKKECKSCQKIKPLDESFYRHPGMKDGYLNICKVCFLGKAKDNYQKRKEEIKIRAKQYRQDNLDIVQERERNYSREHREERTPYHKEYRIKRKKELQLKDKIYREKNQERIREINRAYRLKHFKQRQENQRKYRRNRYQTDEKFRVVIRLRAILGNAFRAYSKYGKKYTSKKYGIDYEKIFQHLGPCPGPREEWHIDHIKPLCLFDFDDPVQVREAFSPANHQWLPKELNLKKSSKYNDQVLLPPESFHLMEI